MDKVSQKVMQNVGTAALVSALVLVNAEEKTVLDLIDETKMAAFDRLKAEYDLSENAISETNNPKNEIEILNGWLIWYKGVLDTFTDLQIGGPSDKVNQSISEAKADVIAYANSLMEAINEL